MIRGDAPKKKKKDYLGYFPGYFLRLHFLFSKHIFVVVGMVFWGPRTVVTSGVGLFMQIVSPCHENPPFSRKREGKGTGGKKGPLGVKKSSFLSITP